MARVRKHAFSQRTFGGTAIILAYLACGRYDVYYVAPGTGMGVWDFAAGALLIEEAGGTLQLPDGSPYTMPASGMCAAAAPDTLDELRALLRD
jgi:myo-inositol-1(or 4)-monophosphatase